MIAKVETRLRCQHKSTHKILGNNMNPHPFKSLQTWFPENTVLPLWPQTSEVEGLDSFYTHNNTSPTPMEREISQVVNPELMIVPPAVSNGIGVLLIPGGSYKRVAFDKEGVDTANVLSQKGYTVFVMTYRMPGDGHNEGNLVSLADAQRALRIIRSQKDKWSLQHIGVIGFSAGGHVACSLATRYALKTNESVDGIDVVSARPDFVTLMYPVISMDQTIGHPGSRHELLGEHPDAVSISEFSMETQVSEFTPPCLLIHASDDPAVNVENSVVFWQALKRHNVPTEMHLFEHGGHGFGIRDTIGLPVQVWPNLFDLWVQRQLAQTTN